MAESQEMLETTPSVPARRSDAAPAMTREMRVTEQLGEELVFALAPIPIITETAIVLFSWTSSAENQKCHLRHFPL